MATSSIRQEAYSGMAIKLTNMESAITTVIAAHKDKDKELTQQEALALQFQIHAYNIVVSTMSTISKELSDMIKGILAKV